MSAALILFGLITFSVCICLYLVELALELERTADADTDLSLEDLLDLDDGPHAGIVIDLADHQVRLREQSEGFDDVA